ncbi:alpha/beta hydrolase [Bacillus sp. ISL-8]|uniref:Alpha/beta hydrolase n=1 Tax=Bacillus mycoides TaxID=1405 RepID=A0A1W6AAN4_BACMY|nr:alpha/beta hydrolase [Bacillus mycoides]ARJ22840.1 alpha/beta hydrolase [Bacillus mycoides]MBT2581176.1 alpha/beta hydrolase [Bacillus sp. ISL-8]TKI85333.1 alpha/beta hydrolase [Bacillus mycoides]
MGGMIAQIVALRNPQRVLSITLIASSIFGSEDNKRNLPPIDEKILTYHANGAKLNWSDEESVANYLVTGSVLFCGSKHKIDEKRAYKQVEKEIKRANNLLSMFNHSLLKGDDSYEGKLKEINIPTLVIHGTEDTVFPYEHGLALVNEIPHAVLLTLEGSGHEIHCDDWVHIISAISNHTSLL